MRWWMLLPFFVVGAVVTDDLRARARASEPSAVEAMLEPSAIPPEVLRFLSLGFRSAAADASYLDAIQLFGDRGMVRDPLPARVRRSRAIARRLEETTDLDPRFDYAYVFGALAIPVRLDEGRAENVDEAIHLLRKGVGESPTDWRIPFHLGFLLSTYRGDFTGAAEAMAEAAKRPGRPEYLPLLATRLAANGASLATGLALARAMLTEASTDEERARLEERVRLLEMERDLRAIEAAADRHRARTGSFPASVEALVREGELPALPEEPHGGRYLLDPSTGTARSSAAERLIVYGLPRRGDGPRAATTAPTPVEKQQP